MQFFKNNFYKITTLVAIAILIVSQSQFYVKAQESDTDQSVKQESEIGSESTNTPLAESNLAISNPIGANCTSKLRLMPSSSVYAPNLNYDYSFIPSETSSMVYQKQFFQDINGDNLPDYLYTHNYLLGNITYPDFTLVHTGCVYLHNGTGLQQTYVCYAQTKYNQQGQVLEGIYRGDCAGSTN